MGKVVSHPIFYLGVLLFLGLLDHLFLPASFFALISSPSRPLQSSRAARQATLHMQAVLQRSQGGGKRREMS
jgi:hypothetical protein